MFNSQNSRKILEKNLPNTKFIECKKAHIAIYYYEFQNTQDKYKDDNE